MIWRACVPGSPRFGNRSERARVPVRTRPVQEPLVVSEHGCRRALDGEGAGCLLGRLPHGAELVGLNAEVNDGRCESLQVMLRQVTGLAVLYCIAHARR